MKGGVVRSVLTYLFGGTMVLAGAAHFLQPDFFLGFFGGAPAWVPALLLIYASGVVEIASGVLTLVPSTRRMGALLILLLMVGFLPVHVVDLLREHPVVGSDAAAWIRLPMQLVLIAWAYFIGPLWESRRRASP